MKSSTPVFKNENLPKTGVACKAIDACRAEFQRVPRCGSEPRSNEAYHGGLTGAKVPSFLRLGAAVHERGCHCGRASLNLAQLYKCVVAKVDHMNLGSFIIRHR